jgi:hypothetical protein
MTSESVTLNVSGWCDAQLKGIRWVNDLGEVQLSLQLAGRPEAAGSINVRIRWVQRFEASVTQDALTGGSPLVWDARSVILANGQSELVLDLGGAGHLRISAEEFVVEDG